MAYIISRTLENKIAIAENNNQNTILVTLDVLKEILALLKEQEAVEPINSYGTFRCGNCENIVGYNDGHGRGYQNNFCSKCGKAVKWKWD